MLCKKNNYIINYRLYYLFVCSLTQIRIYLLLFIHVPNINGIELTFISIYYLLKICLSISVDFLL